MKTEFNVSVSFDIYIDLEQCDITQEDILSAFGAEQRELSEREIHTYIREYMAAEDIYQNGNIQQAQIINVQHVGKVSND